MDEIVIIVSLGQLTSSQSNSFDFCHTLGMRPVPLQQRHLLAYPLSPSLSVFPSPAQRKHFMDDTGASAGMDLRGGGMLNPALDI
jgi:hypothetical protein